jgi:arsenate reductase
MVRLLGLPVEKEAVVGGEKGKRRVLFLCTGNSCRSQMAEGWARFLRSDTIEPYSAGVELHGMNANAVRVMSEVGVDISGQRSKRAEELRDVSFEVVVTVCDNAHESCPVFPAATKVVHVGFDDPPRLAKNAKTEAEALGHYRRVRDEIRDFIEHLDERLAASAKGE